VTKEYHYEMPFEVQADGPYFNILDFFGRMSRLSRIINVGDLVFADPSSSGNKGAKYPVRRAQRSPEFLQLRRSLPSRVKPVLQQQVRRNRRGNPERE